MKKILLVILMLMFGVPNLFAFSIEEWNLLVTSIGKSEDVIKKEAKSKNIYLEKKQSREGYYYGYSSYNDSQNAGEKKDISAISFGIQGKVVNYSFCQLIGKGATNNILSIIEIKKEHGELEYIKNVQDYHGYDGDTNKVDVFKTNTGYFVQTAIGTIGGKYIIGIKVSKTEIF